MDEQATLQLWCATIGIDNPFVFPVDVSVSQRVTQVKDDIYDKLENVYHQNASGLELWKTNMKVQRSENLQTLLEKSGGLDRIALKLGCLSKISDIFSGGQMQDSLDIIVRLNACPPPQKRVRFVPGIASKDESDSGATMSLSISQHFKSSRSRSGRTGIIRLSGSVMKRQDQVAFCLYNHFWGTEEDNSWFSISHVIEDHVPGFETNGTSKASRATLVDLTSLLQWTPSDDILCMLTPKFIIRDEYIQLDKYLDEHDRLKHVLLNGQSGIGKTVYLTYSLLKRLIARRPTIYARTPQNCYLFLDSGVYWIPGHSFERDESPLSAQKYRDGLVLFDLNYRQTQIGSFESWRMVVAASSQPSEYKRWKRDYPVDQYVMSTWSWPELYFARDIARIRRSPAMLYAAFLKYGGTARDLFHRLEEDVDDELSFAIDNWADLVSPCPNCSTCHDNLSSPLIAINPKIDANGDVNRRYFRGQIASQYILEQLLARQPRGSSQDTFQRLLRRYSG